MSEIYPASVLGWSKEILLSRELELLTDVKPFKVLKERRKICLNDLDQHIVSNLVIQPCRTVKTTTRVISGIEIAKKIRGGYRRVQGIEFDLDLA